MKKPPSSGFYGAFKGHLKRRFLVGLVIFTPFALTLFLLIRFISFSKSLMIKPILSSMEYFLSPEQMKTIMDMGPEEYRMQVEYPALAASLLITLVLLYFVGLLSATFFGRRFIAVGERILSQIPGAQFCYNLFKNVMEILSRPQSQAFQKVVLIDYPRMGIRGMAFYSGLTHVSETDEWMINVFIPTTPNPTSGFLLLMKPEEVLETNLDMAEATRFIISGGVVQLENFVLKPFPLQEQIDELRLRQRIIKKEVQKEVQKELEKSSRSNVSNDSKRSEK